MKIHYDKAVDALSVTLKRGKVERTVTVTPEIMVDFDASGNPLYIEILDASQKIGKKQMSHITIGGKQIPLAV